MEKRSGKSLDRKKIAIVVDDQLNRLVEVSGEVSFLSKMFMSVDERYILDLAKEDLEGLSTLLGHIACDIADVRNELRPLAEDGEEVTAQ